MIIPQTTLPINVEIIPVLPEQASVLANLLELYIYDFSEFIDLEIGANGRFGYNSLPLYWKESSRQPFFITINGNLAGFILLQKGSQISDDKKVWDISEFFVMRGYRRRGVGMKAAHKIWKQFLGKWEIRVREQNQKAKEFWAHTIGLFLNKNIQPTLFTENDTSWHVFTFESNHIA